MRPVQRAANNPAAETHPWAANRASAHLAWFAVECRKKTNRQWYVFERYGTREEAEQVRACLVGLGEETRIVPPT